MKMAILPGFALLAAFAVPPGNAAAQSVTVFHGAKSETVSVDRRDGATPVVARGEGPPAAAPTEHIRRAPADRYAAVGGDLLWVIDRKTGDVTACARGGNGMVGGRVIRCTDGSTGR
jgi:hypothetical protein